MSMLATSSETVSIKSIGMFIETKILFLSKTLG